MREHVFILAVVVAVGVAVVVAVVGCGGASEGPTEEQPGAGAPKSELPGNITVTPVDSIAVPTNAAPQPGKLTLGEKYPESSKVQPIPTNQLGSAAQSKAIDIESPKETASSLSKVEGEGNLIREKGEYLAGGSPFDGQFVDHHDNGNKSVEGEFVNGKQQGVWTFYHENGNRYRTGNYVDSRANGQWTFWRADGSKWSEQTYANGQLNGFETRWHPNGEKQSESTWQGGKTIETKEWDEQGMPKQ
ncbi:MAG TPA: hypothetical protein QGH16_04825 [Verrucomicrobiota bacterium]|nr:hypothetical protein [Verrucomicrobiota bacterium]